ncbi:uncharacterized protein LOC134835266 [Culicoides brevitarsis]|uniref:uncharacterized protein LOC134835266 n=1 Tax=Culicoides brevitarsis TaxID=469753 RepID=UPI00307B1EF4
MLNNANVAASHVININLLQSLSQAVNPYHRKFYAFLCFNDDSAYRQTLLKKMNFATFGIADTSSANLPYGPEFSMATLLFDLACEGTRSFWEMLDLEMMVTNKILLWNVSKEQHEMIKRKEGLEGIIEVYLVEEEQVDKEILVTKVTKKEFHRIPQFIPFAVWTNETLQILQPASSFISRDRYDLQGASIRVCIVIPTPDTRHHLADGVDRHIDTNTKHSYFVTLELLEFLNATPVYSYETIWGYFNKSSNSWNGMIQKLINRETDISGTAIWVTANRVSIIQYVYRTSAADVWFLFQNPRLSFTDNLFLLPFSQVTWICAFLLVPVLAVGITFIRYYSEVKIERQREEQKAELGESFYMILTIVCQQGFTNTIHSISARLLMFFSFFTLMLLYVSYAASLVALLQSSSKRINSLQDLLESKMKLGVEDAAYNRIYFAMQRDPIKKAIYERKVINRDGTKNFIPVEKGIEKVRNELYAFHTEVGNAYRFITESYNQNEKCRLNRLKYLEVDSPYHLIRKNATYKEIVTVALSRITEHGILKKVTEPFYAEKPGCTGSSVKFFAINLHDVQPAFIFLGSGYAISLLIFVMEVLIAQHHKRKKLNRVEVEELEEIE